MMNLRDEQYTYRYSTGGINTPIEFFSKALSNSIKFDIGLGFFSSASINVLADGFAHFISNGGTMRLYINQYLSKEDLAAITSNATNIIAQRVINDFWEMKKLLSKRDEHFFNCLSYLISTKRIEIKIVIPIGGGIAHQKFGIFSDCIGNKASFSGSLNLTANALVRNLETIECEYSWMSDYAAKKIYASVDDFELIFNGRSPNIKIYDATQLEDIVIKEFPSKEIEGLLEDEKSIANEIIKETLHNNVAQNTNKPVFPWSSKPRKYQEDAYIAWCKNDYQGIFAMATGTGKTITSLNCVLEEYKKTNQYKVLILVPSIDLVNQWVDEVAKFNFTNVYKVCGSSNWRSELTVLKEDIKWGIDTNYVIISTYDSFSNETLLRIVNDLGDRQILIADEAHNVGSTSVRKAFENLRISNRIALSATPKRNYDIEGTMAIEQLFNDKPPYCYSFSMRRAISEGFLMKYLYYPVVAYLEENEMKSYVYYTQKLLSVFDQKTGKFDASNPNVEKWLMARKRIIHKANDKYRVFENISDELASKDQLKYCFVYVPEGYKPDSENQNDKDRIIYNLKSIIDNKYPSVSTNTYLGGDSHKKDKLKGFGEGDINMLFAMKCLDEGVDVPRAEIGIFASSTGNPRQFIQRRGRLLRKHDDKTFAKIYDIIVVPNFHSSHYDDKFFEMEKSLVRNEMTRVAYFASLATNYNESKKGIEDVLDFYNFEISALIEELDEQ